MKRVSAAKPDSPLLGSRQPGESRRLVRQPARHDILTLRQAMRFGATPDQVNAVSNLQRTIGNRASTQLLRRPETGTRVQRAETGGDSFWDSVTETVEGLVEDIGEAVETVASAAGTALSLATYPGCDSVPARPSLGSWLDNTGLDSIRHKPDQYLSRGSSPDGDSAGATSLVKQALLAWGCETYGLNLLPTYGTKGYFGPETAAALKQFQLRELEAPDGVLGPDTLEALDEYMGVVRLDRPPTPSDVGGSADQGKSTLRITGKSIATIYFSTDEDALDLDDETVLTSLVGHVSGATSVSLQLYGYADKREGAGDNVSLADRRAINVHVKLEELFEGTGIDYDVTWYRLGEIERPQPGETEEDLKPFRRVDIQVTSVERPPEPVMGSCDDCSATEIETGEPDPYSGKPLPRVGCDLLCVGQPRKTPKNLDVPSEDCTESQRASIRKAASQADDWLAAAIPKLGESPLPEKTRDALWLIFREDSASTAGKVRKSLQRIRNGIRTSIFECEQKGSLLYDFFCAAGTVGYVHLYTPLTIHLCMGLWEGADSTTRTHVLIHEEAHRTLGGGDPAYFEFSSCEEELDTAGLRPDQRLDMADAYPCIVRLLLHGAAADLQKRVEIYRGETIRSITQGMPYGVIDLNSTDSVSGRLLPAFSVMNVPGFKYEWTFIAPWGPPRVYDLPTLGGGSGSWIPETLRDELKSRGIAYGDINLDITIPSVGEKTLTLPVRFKY
jgi:outer membrane protein OmpA-like peptidoglycan-associated protein